VQHVRSTLRSRHAGEHNSPVRIVAFNTAEGWSRDVTVDIAEESVLWKRRPAVNSLACP
jgi:hypothetical protein